jgi:hypothetical protein
MPDARPAALAETDWIMTASGLAFYPLEPRIEDIRLDDLAHALAATNRFNGHAREPYSVAQHAVLVSQEMERATDDTRGFPWEWGLYGLLHDGSEAYLGDVPRPLKRQDTFAAYRAAEERLQAAIYGAFGLHLAGEPAALKVIDRRMLRTEQQYLMPPPAPGEDRADVEPLPIGISPWPFAFAKAAFVRRFNDLQALRDHA